MLNSLFWIEAFFGGSLPLKSLGCVSLWNLKGLTVLNGLMPINKLVVSISLLSSTWQWMVTLEMGGKDRPPTNYNKEVTRGQWSSTSQGMEGLELHKSLRESH